MKIKFLIGLAMTAFLMTACSNEEELTSTATKGMLKATVEGSSLTTRVGFDREGSFYWSTGDKLGVTTSNSQQTFTEFTLSSGSGLASGTFTGYYTGSIEGYAVYPYNNGSHSMSGTTLTYNFPESYTYTKVDTDYFTETQGTGNSFNPAMWGEIQNGNVHLKHLGGVFCIKVEKMPVEAKKLILTADKQIAGSFAVDLSATTPTLNSTNSSGSNTVTIDFSSATVTEGQTGVFYVPVPVGTYTVSIQMIDGQNNNVMNLPAGTFSIILRRAQMLIVNNGTVSGTEQQSVDELSEAATQLGNSDAVAVTGQIAESNNEISIPAVSESTTGTSTKSLLLKDVANGASIKIADAASSGGDGETKKSVENFTLSIPNNESTNVEELLDVEVEMPNTTVTLTGNAGVAKYGNVKSKTADKTLIISSGVVVNNVDVVKGNVRVNKGAELKGITRAEGNTSKVFIYKESDAKVPGELDSNVFEVVDADVADLQKKAAEGGTFQLKKDIVLSSPLVVEKEMTLDLNSFALKANQSSFTDAAGLAGSYQGVVLVRRGGHLTVKDGTGNGSIDCNQNEGVYSAIVLTNGADESDETLKTQPAKLTVEGGHLKGFYYGICGNGNRHTTEITINGGTVEGVNGSGVYHPQDGTMTVTGGEIKGANTGVELRSGTINVSGGKFVATAKEFSEKASGNGTTMSGVALAVSQHSTDKDISVTITGGEFTGVKALYENDLQNENSSNITLDVKKGTSTGGIFNGEIYSENCTEFITGGTFSDPNVLHYLGTDAEVAINLDKSYSTDKPLNIAAGTDVTIDLKENTLTSTCKSSKSLVNGKAYIKNGSINVAETIRVRENGDLTLDNVEVTETNHTALQAQGPNVKLTVKNNSVIRGKYFGCSTNAANSSVGQTPTYGANATLVLENSTFTSEETGFMNNVPADVTITNCEFSGTCQGALLRGGEYTITNSTFTLNAAKDKNSYVDGSWPANSDKWADGNRCTYAAITIGNQNNNSYKYHTIVKMEKVTANVQGTYANQYSAVYVAANKEENLGVTWTYDSQCAFGGSGQGSVTYGNNGENITVNGNPPTVNPN